MSLTAGQTPVRQQPRLGDLLVRGGLISANQLESALWAQYSRRRRLGEVLLEGGLIDEIVLSAALSFQLDAPLINLRDRPSTDEALALLPQQDAARLMVLPLSLTDGRLEVAVDDPGDSSLLAEVTTLTGCQILPRLAVRSEIDGAIGQRYGMTRGPDRQEATATSARSAPGAAVSGPFADAADLVDAPVEQIVNLLVAHAIRSRAIEIHIEPRPNALQIRARIDGALHEVIRLPADLGPDLARQIKTLSGLKTVDEPRAQDGKFMMEVEERQVDISVATVRTMWGEKIVLRFLDRSRKMLRLDELGFPDALLSTYREQLKSRSGMVIVCGPTDSGKTTTLYASLIELDPVALSISTVEDPIEETLAEVNQTRVDTSAGTDFAGVLRTIVRQDPDVILVGDIPDRETAEIAAHAALTGHLVLTSMHTTDAASAIIRLLEMGVEPFLVADGVAVVVAQRLVRRVCPHCRFEIETMTAEQTLDPAEDIEGARAWIGRGCTHCNDTGFLDRVGTFELLRVTPAMRGLIGHDADYDHIRAQALLDGMRPLRTDALRKAAAGATTANEAIRCTGR